MATINILKQLTNTLSLSNEVSDLGFRYAQNVNINKREDDSLNVTPRAAVTNVALFPGFPTTKSSVPIDDSYHLLYTGTIASSSDYFLFLSRINATQATLNVTYLNTANPSLFTNKVLHTVTIGSTKLRDAYSTCLGFSDKQQLYFIVANLLNGDSKSSFVVNIRVSLASILTSGTTSTFQGLDGVQGLSSDSMSATLIKNGGVLTDTLTFISKNNFIPETTSNNYTNVTFSTAADPSPGFNNTYLLVVSVAGELASATYYPMSYWVSDVPRIQNTSESRLPTGLASRFFVDEPNTSPFIVVSNPAGLSQATDGRVGKIVVTFGLPAANCYAITEGGTIPESPVTVSNNRFILGRNFMSFAANQTGSSYLMTGVTRPRYFFQLGNFHSIVVLTASNTPHYMYTLSASGTDVFSFGSINPSMVGGYLASGAFGQQGDIVTFVRVRQQLSNPLNTRTPIQRSTYIINPISPLGRVNDVDSLSGSDTRYFPIFGIDTQRIDSFFKLSNRLAVVLDDGSLYLSTLGQTHSDYPPIFDFQVKLDGTDALNNAVKIKLNSQVTGIIEIPNGGYLITTSNGLYQYDANFNVVSLVKPGNYTGVINNDGIIQVVSDSTIYNYYYDDERKTVVEISATEIPSGVNYFTTNALYKYQDYPLPTLGRICGIGNNWITFISKQILHKYVYECPYAQVIGKYVSTIANSLSNYTFLPVRFTSQVTAGSNTIDSLSVATTGNWSSGSIASLTLQTDVRQYPFNFVASIAPGNAIAASTNNFTSNAGVMPFYCSLLSTRQSYGKLLGNDAIAMFKQSKVDVSFSYSNPIINLSYFPTYYRNATIVNTSTGTFLFEVSPRAFSNEYTAVTRTTYTNTVHYFQWANGAISNISIDIEATMK